MRVISLPLLLSLALSATFAEPIVRGGDGGDGEGEDDYSDTAFIEPDIPKTICVLPGSLGFSGNITLLEDCEAVDRFSEVIPTSLGLYGSTVLICCPDPLPIGHESAILFPGDYGTPEYDEYVASYEDYEEYGDYGGKVVGGGVQPGAEVRGTGRGNPREECKKIAPGLASDCVPLLNCSHSALNAEEPPLRCGALPEVQEQLYCCTTLDPPGYNPNDADEENFNVRDPGPGFRARECEDHSKMCSTWAELEPSSCYDPNHFSFDVMAVACQKSCGTCKTRGCLDEVPKCKDWSLTHCAASALFMSIHCRASCGTCGFRSPRNGELQIVDGKEFSNIDNRRFYCGEGRSFEEIDVLHENNVKEEEREDGSNRVELTPASVTPRTQEDKLIKKRINAADFSVERAAIDSGLSSSIQFPGDGKKRKKRSPQLVLNTGGGNEREFDPNKLELFYYGTETEGSGRGIRCGAVILSDRFVLFAAHCHVSFGPHQVLGFNSDSVKTILVRDGTKNQESIPIRRIFTHPDYVYLEAYADIAVIELSHRILYDFNRYGDTPSCLGRKGEPLAGQRAISDGYGFTEKGRTSDVLLRINVTVIDNADCADYLKSNVTKHSFNRQRLHDALPKGINEQIMCTTGDKLKDDKNQTIYSGPCEGDSGGPLYVDHGGPDGRKRRTVEGIVFGGLTCGGNIPAWYTRVGAYRSWIRCIMKQTKGGRTKAEIEKRCKSRATKYGVRNSLI